MSSKTETTWIYFLSHHGPGHQSTTDGFIEVEKGKEKDKEYIKELVEDRMEHRYNVTYWWWRIPHPPRPYVASKICAMKELIQEAKEKLKRLRLIDSDVIQEDGKDEAMESILGTMGESLADELIKRKVVVTRSDIFAWRQGKRKPAKSIRRKVINAIKAAKRYPGRLK